MRPGLREAAENVGEEDFSISCSARCGSMNDIIEDDRRGSELAAELGGTYIVA